MELQLRQLPWAEDRNDSSQPPNSMLRRGFIEWFTLGFAQREP